MLIVGAKGLAKEVVEIIHKTDSFERVVFYDDLKENTETKFLKLFQIVKSIGELKLELEQDNRFTLAIGNPLVRKRYYELLIANNGVFTSLIHPHTYIGSLDVKLCEGCIVMHNVTIANGSRIGKGVILYNNVQITHDCKVGDFSILAPGATLLGGARIGANTQIGANATILPNVRVGYNVIVGAGAVVVSDILDNTIVAGVPAKNLHGDKR